MRERETENLMEFLSREYPSADDRSGRPEDFANFPIFIRNLKRAVASSSGGRSGVTITVPVSYWYLQHFDIVSLEPWVDWFNVMSYDLHGAGPPSLLLLSS